MSRGLMMFAFALWCALSGGTACRGETVPETLHERIAVTLDPASHQVSGESTVTLNPRGAASVSFSLHPGATVHRVSVEGREVAVAFAGDALVVPLPPAQGERTVRVTIGYRATFNDPLPERTATAEDPGYGVNGVISTEGVFLGGGVAWYPRPHAVPARRTIAVTAPAGIEAVTAGRRLERRSEGGKSISVWEEEHPVKHLSLSAGRYMVSERQSGPLPLHAYLSAGNAPLADAYLAASADYLKLYEGLFGPYPFEKFAVVENFIPTGYGFPSYTLLGGTVIRLPFIIGTSLPHEIAHNWWGNGVLVDYREGNWAEGLVTYLADHLLEQRKSPAAGRDYRFRLLADYAALVSPASDFPLREFTARRDPASRAIGYGKGAMLFHMVRTMIGDDAFLEALRELCRERLYRPASWGDFSRAFSRAAGRDLAPFIDQWLTRTGGPRLSLAEVTSREEAGRWLVRGRIVQAPPYWSVPVILKAETAGEEARRTVVSDRDSVPFTISLSAPPRRLLLDPDADLFRVLAREEIPPAINRVKGSRQLLVITGRGCRARPETLALLLESLGQRGARVVREEEVKGPELAGHDLLFCGVPERPGLLPPLPQGVTVSPQGFAVEQETFGSADDTLFVVAGHPFDPDRLAALFLPLSRDAADACVTKITHYGKYGYLVFSRGVNRKKGVMPAGGGGTMVEF
ncbi:MAG: M1 family peptidase [Geobacteraceae bacterium]|nr:M1 family peptidase [Geobacteraceae bacterium]